jgi:hypothetical protein
VSGFFIGAIMAGTIPLSMTQQFDEFGKPLKGGQLFIIQAGTVSTPQDAFQDTGLTIKQPYPITLDAAGRIPQFFLADGSVKVRLQDKSGVVQLAADSVLVIGPSAGGGGGSTVDPTQLIQTGNMIFRYGFGALSGYVRLNNLTIGSATSGATERANADTQALYLYLWGIDPTLTVSGGRGASALADWTANKQLSLPDWRGYAMGALDDMGNTPAGRLTAPVFGANPLQLGAAGGLQTRSKTLTLGEMPQHFHGAPIFDPGHIHTFTAIRAVPSGIGLTGSSAQQANTDTGQTSQNTTGIRISSPQNGTDNTNNTGGGNPFSYDSIGPRKLATFYIKL